MSLTDDLATIKPQYATFEKWLASEPAEADEVLNLIRDKSVQAEGLLRVLRKHGIPCSRETVRAYRDGTLG